MAIPDIVPVMHDDMFRDYYRQSFMWFDWVFDVAGVFTRAGDTYRIPISITRYDADGDQAGGATLSSGTVALQDNSSEVIVNPALADTAWQDPTIVDANYIDLTLDQERDSRILVPYLAEERTLPSFIDESVSEQAYTIAKAVNADIREEWEGITGDQAIAGPTVASFATNWGDDDHLDAIYEMFRTAMKKAQNYHWRPMSGWKCMVGPDMWDLLIEVLVDKNLYLQTDETGRAFLNGQAPPLRGFDVYLDDSIDLIDGAGTLADEQKKANVYFCGPRLGVGFAQDFEMTRVFESEVRKGYLSDMLISWGVKILNPRYQMLGQTTISAA